MGRRSKLQRVGSSGHALDHSVYSQINIVTEWLDPISCLLDDFDISGDIHVAH